MPTTDDSQELVEAARAAIDEEALAEVLELTAEAEYGAAAPAALREVLTDELVADAVAAADRARRRGRGPTGDDIGAAADRRRECCGPPMQPTHAWVESS